MLRDITTVLGINVNSELVKMELINILATVFLDTMDNIATETLMIVLIINANVEENVKMD